MTNDDLSLLDGDNLETIERQLKLFPGKRFAKACQVRADVISKSGRLPVRPLSPFIITNIMYIFLYKLNFFTKLI